MPKKDIKTRIEKVLKIKKLTLVGKTVNDIPTDHHTFYSIVKNDKGKEFFFKFLITDVRFKEKTFKREVLFLKFLKDNKKIYLPVPKYGSSSFLKNNTWFLRAKADGYILGDRLNYSTKFYTKKNIKILNSFISQLQKYTEPVTDFFKKNQMPLTKKGYSWFLKDFQKDYDFSASYGEIKNKLITKKNIKKINNFLKQNQSLLNKNLVLTHGDLQAENLIFNQGRMTVIDWENLHLNNRLFDWGYIWLNSWNKPSWRKQLEQTVVLSIEDKILFTINKIRWLIRMIGLLDHGNKTNINNRPVFNKIERIKNNHLDQLKKIIKNDL